MSPDDPQFTAYAIDALPTCERVGLEAEIWADSELRAECIETAAFAEKLKRALSIELNAGLTETHWREIHAEAAIVGLPNCPSIAPSPRNRFPVWAFPAAAGVLFGAVIASLALTWGDKPRAIASEETSSQVETAPPLSVMETPSAAKPLAGGIPLLTKFPAKESGPEAKTSARSEILPTGVVMGSAMDQPIFSSPRTTQELREFLATVPVSNFFASPIANDPENQSLNFPDPVSADITSRDALSLSLAASAMTSLPALNFIPSPPSIPNGNVKPPTFSGSPTPSITQQPGTVSKGTKPSVTEKKNEPADHKKLASAPYNKIAWRRTDDMFASTTADRKSRAGVSSSDPSLEPMRLDTDLYPTLEYLNVILERDDTGEAQRAEVSKSDTATVEQFHFRDAPDVKVLVMLQANGIPAYMMMGTTKVLGISDPFVVRP
jgi:hypothetical protein